MTIPTKVEAQDILRPYHGLIWRIIHEAWGEWRAVQAMRIEAELSPLIYRRTVSNYVFDAIARRAIPLFHAEERVSVGTEAQTFKIFFASRLLARFKKGGEDKLGSSIPTQAALAFMEAEGVLPGMPPETAKVEFIWQPNEIWTKVDRVLVVARDGEQLVWDYEIDEPGEAAAPIPIRPPGVDPDGSDDDLIKPKSRPDTITNRG